MGGSATEGGEGEKASFLNVAASEATAIEPPPEEKPSFPFAAPSGEALSAKSSEEKPSFPIAAASEATSFWERRVAGGNVDRAVVGGKTVVSRRRAVADSLGGSAIAGVEGEKTPVLSVACRTKWRSRRRRQRWFGVGGDANRPDSGGENAVLSVAAP